MKEKKRRSLAKTISWRIIATIVTIGGIYIFEHNLCLATGIGLGINAVKMVLYYIYERGWNRINWGKTRS